MCTLLNKYRCACVNHVTDMYICICVYVCARACIGVFAPVEMSTSVLCAHVSNIVNAYIRNVCKRKQLSRA